MDEKKFGTRLTPSDSKYKRTVSGTDYGAPIGTPIPKEGGKVVRTEPSKGGENMKINWKVRLRHPAFYSALVGFIGFILADLQILPVGQFETYAELFFAILIAGGVITDMTTAGLSDSERALTYNEPKE